MADPIRLQFIVDDVDASAVESAINNVISSFNRSASAEIKLKADTTGVEAKLNSLKRLISEIDSHKFSFMGGGTGGSGGSSNPWKGQISGIDKSISKLKEQGFYAKEVAEANRQLQATYNGLKSGAAKIDNSAMQAQVTATQDAIAKAKQLRAEYQQVAALWNQAKISEASAKGTSGETEAAARRLNYEKQMLQIEQQAGVTREQMARYTNMTVSQEKQLAKAIETSGTKRAKDDTAALNALNRRQQAMRQLESYYQRWGTNISKNAELQERYNNLLADMRSGNLNQAELSKFMLDCKEAGVEVDTLGSKVKRLFQTRFGSMAASMLFMGVVNGLRNVWQNVKEVDVAMTELKKVTDETAATYDRFLSNAGTRAQTIGATVSDVVQATAEFARLGYTLQQATQMSDSALVLKNVGDGITDISDASEKMISTMKAFPEFENNSMAIVDKMNEVGNNYAISTSGIAEALQRSAGALAAAGNTLDESIALAVGMNNVTQDPAKVGGQ